MRETRDCFRPQCVACGLAINRVRANSVRGAHIAPLLQTLLGLPPISLVGTCRAVAIGPVACPSPLAFATIASSSALAAGTIVEPIATTTVVVVVAISILIVHAVSLVLPNETHRHQVAVSVAHLSASYGTSARDGA